VLATKFVCAPPYKNHFGQLPSILQTVNSTHQWVTSNLTEHFVLLDVDFPMFRARFTRLERSQFDHTRPFARRLSLYPPSSISNPWIPCDSEEHASVSYTIYEVLIVTLPAPFSGRSRLCGPLSATVLIFRCRRSVDAGRSIEFSCIGRAPKSGPVII
jgi:hypothetical protein